jgi:hypothetical protein
LTIALGDDAKYRGMSYAEIRALDGNFHTWKLRWKSVAVKDSVECFENNASTSLGISCDRWPDF